MPKKATATKTTTTKSTTKTSTSTSKSSNSRTASSGKTQKSTSKKPACDCKTTKKSATKQAASKSSTKPASKKSVMPDWLKSVHQAYSKSSGGAIRNAIKSINNLAGEYFRKELKEMFSPKRLMLPAGEDKESTTRIQRLNFDIADSLAKIAPKLAMKFEEQAMEMFV